MPETCMRDGHRHRLDLTRVNSGNASTMRSSAIVAATSCAGHGSATPRCRTRGVQMKRALSFGQQCGVMRYEDQHWARKLWCGQCAR
eukprot:3875756-Prymnesium_polylepis.1